MNYDHNTARIGRSIDREETSPMHRILSKFRLVSVKFVLMLKVVEGRQESWEVQRSAGGCGNDDNLGHVWA